MIGQYAHGNEPSHHVAYLYNNIGKPEKTRKLVMQIMKEMYRNTPDGICGNEDCGQMSAWYVMSAMGFYPVDPCGGEYELGVPLFPEVKLNLENGNVFKVTKNGNKGKAYLNGKRIKSTTISHKEIMSGGVLEFK